MDEFERRLSDQLDAGGRAVHASDALGPAVRRKVRRRKALASAAAALPMLLLIVGAVWVFNTTDESSNRFLEVDAAIDGSSTTAPATTTSDPPANPPGDVLRAALVGLGAAVDDAPDRAVSLGSALWCGLDRADHSSAPDPADTGLCLIEAGTAGRDAAMIRVQPTIEGDPIVTVIRSVGSDTEAEIYIDSSQDNFGAPGWIELRCLLDPLDPGDALYPLTWSDCFEPMFAPDQVDEGVIATLAPGETVDVVWPDTSFLGDEDAAPIYLLGEPDSQFRRTWGLAGEATRNDDNTATLRLVGPTRAASLEHSEFGPASFVAVESGRYEVALLRSELRDQGNLVYVDITSAGGERTDLDAPIPTVDSANAILRAGGVGGVDFGLSRAQTITALEAEFGVPVTYQPFEGCVTTGYATVGDFLVVEFWGDEEGDETGFEAWHYGGPNWLEEILGGTLNDIGLTTESGIGVGSSLAEVVAVGGSASGGYDDNWGAGIWYENQSIAGLLSADMTDAAAAVTSLSGGRAGAPARMVC